MELLLLLLLLIDTMLPVPSLQRLRPSVPEEFTAPLELQQQHFGLVDDYGIKPRHPKFRTRAPRKESEKLHIAHKSKRDEPDLEEYYYDNVF
ncbi:protein Frey isoform X2 [Hemicordylus capensis]|uniref:protein Frey isoform X2 n=1 Tax=Hemicordylus capensis TaxID=884348 RepID=UPI002304613E|nr:protein Frey isoform X2 [Hemicordylus capensis]